MPNKHKKISQARIELGYTILELMVTLGIVSILALTAVYNLRQINSPIKNATFSVEQFIRLARANAISGTQMIQVQPISATVIGTYSGSSCSGTMTAISNGTLTMPSGSSLLETNWTVCFNQRGVTSASTLFHIKDNKGNSRAIRVALGGGTKTSNT
jgi:prepilin-type N-terminal cleavage/methylation domain-containing protein